MKLIKVKTQYYVEQTLKIPWKFVKRLLRFADVGFQQFSFEEDKVKILMKEKVFYIIYLFVYSLYYFPIEGVG